MPSPLTFEVPLPGTSGWSKVRGREGDLLVIQLRGISGVTRPRRDALRSLGLKGIRSASLRLSTDNCALGNIHKVRDLIAVVEFPYIMYGSNSNAESQDGLAEDVEEFKYGTETRPGGLWRTLDGDYFGFEAERDTLLAYLSIDAPLEQVLGACAEANLAISKDDPRAHIGYSDPTESDELEFIDGPFRTLQEQMDKGALRQALVPFLGGISITWQAPYARFHDSDTERAELGIMTSPVDILVIRNLAQRFMSTDLLATERLYVTAHSRGARREYSV